MASSGEQVIELSVGDTNKLREQLGLAPLRTNKPEAASKIQEHAAAPTAVAGDDEVLELSVDDTNALRTKLGLPPLRSTSSKKEDEHAPAVNLGEAKASADRVEKARLQRQVQQGASQYGKTSLGDEKTSALSFAEQMRQRKKEARKKKSTPKEDKKSTTATAGYSESDVKGLTVGHAVGDFQEGSTTVLTLADTEILTADESSKRTMGLNEDEARLENVNLAEQQTVQEGLREKRKMEMGMGRAGGYAGFDDDEFEELGGTQGPSRTARGISTGVDKTKGSKPKARGFQIGTMLDQQDEDFESDLFAAQSGKAISLQPNQVDRTMSDFMTAEEEAELRPKKEKKKKDKEFKKKKKKDKKDRKRKVESDDEDKEEEVSPSIIASKKKSLADELEESAPAPVVGRKRRRQVDDSDDEDQTGDGIKSMDTAEKRAKFEAVMEKGNERTKAAFSKPKRVVARDDEEPDDAFLNAALAKARRLNRLKQLSQKDLRGADAVAQALEQSGQIKPEGITSTGTSGGSGIKFSINDTREFTLALRAKKEQEQRDRSKKDAGLVKDAPIKREDVVVKTEPDGPEPMTVEEEEEVIDMNELAKEVKDDEPTSTDLFNGGTASIGKGLGGVLQMLRQTGEISRKNAGREEQRGRAKDERTYEDYEPLDLSKVVRIDERNANEKDRDLASREIKLEYRDEHGRLLTRKEAFRDLSYQFHGYGSGKRKEQKKMKQIAREQAEQRVASRQGTAEGGMLGALKATQKVSGKAFVVHKT
eukprot:scaffold4079_cov167-Amphora_coffeaeformis.AAC.21